MDNLSGIAVFVQVANTCSFTDSARLLGVSASAVGKSIARLEQRLGVRLLHRSTRSMTLTPEGQRFLERCRKVLCELEAAQLEISSAAAAPSGRLRISLPRVGELVMPVLIEFMQRYPQIELDIDLSNRMVDIFEEGFDAVTRTGTLQDSRLTARQLGSFSLNLVATPDYLHQHGTPSTPAELREHACLMHRFHASGKLERWPLRGNHSDLQATLKPRAICNSIASLLQVACAGQGIACLPDFMVARQIATGRLQTVLADHLDSAGTFWMLWPTSKYALPKLRALIDHMGANLFGAQPG
ncbi:LysR family transcriptional regulator [Pseudomonas sp. PA1(2017)]|uniref:LysR family transcriptional regulator n=1 Tax=Pseudomonas sp. PA1(2017) TaxID=1932113 RepID=UPI00095EDA0B|nr:LysR family transcriptional regulator [Pseudomonas sp. PA1(2017)]OLU13568.1 LysR family transcriptional regulator [Pseudomonas sp. PA1(2017)]